MGWAACGQRGSLKATIGAYGTAARDALFIPVVTAVMQAAGGSAMDTLTAFGLFAVTAMLVCYALEQRSRWYILGFAGACALGSTYGFLQGAWPFGLVEGVWTFVALARFLRNRPTSARPKRPTV